jgi:hypothetical protein
MRFFTEKRGDRFEMQSLARLKSVRDAEDFAEKIDHSVKQHQQSCLRFVLIHRIGLSQI